MRESGDFSRRAAAFGLVAGPVLLAISSFMDPAWGEEAAEYLDEVGENEGLYIAAGAISTIATLIFIAGTLGLARILRTGGRSLGHVAAILLTGGLIGLTPILAFNGFDTVLADAENREAAIAIWDELEETPALLAYWVPFFVGGIVLGSLLLAIALIKRRIVPIWSPLLLIASTLLGFVSESAVVAGVSFVVLAVAFAPLAALINGMSTSQWRQWMPLDEGEQPPPAPPPPA